MAENKTKASAANPDSYIAAIPDESRRSDCAALMELMSRATKLPPVMWGTAIVGFGTHKYPLAGGKFGEICSVVGPAKSCSSRSSECCHDWTAFESSRGSDVAGAIRGQQCV